MYSEIAIEITCCPLGVCSDFAPSTEKGEVILRMLTAPDQRELQ